MLFQRRAIGRYVLFSLRSVRRRPAMFSVVSGTMVAATIAAVAVLPKSYEVRSRLLAQKNPVLLIRGDADLREQPSRAAAELILGTENLHALIRQTNLLEHWFDHRAPILRLKDWLTARVRGPLRPEKMLSELTHLLEKNLTVSVAREATVEIRLIWPDAVMAYRLVDAAKQNYLEKREVLEISTLEEEISILERHADALRSGIDERVAELQRLRKPAAPGSARAAAPLAPKEADPSEVLKLRATLAARRQAIADLEDMRRARIRDLEIALAQRRALYSDNDPAVQQLKQSIESSHPESPQLAALKREEAELRRKLAEHPDATLLPGTPPVPPELFGAGRDTPGNEDPRTESARAQLRYDLLQYAVLRDRIESARIDLDTSRAAFKHRYSVVLPPLVPRYPLRPNVWQVIFASLVAGLLLALFATTASDLRGGQLLEPWQIEDLMPPSTALVSVHLPRPPAEPPPTRSG